MATTDQVPSRLPAAIDGHAYLIDAKYQRQSVPILRQQSDASDEPGEQSLNPRGLWRRSQESWHHGAGQRFFDSKTSDRVRFRASRGLDPWTEGELSLLARTVPMRRSTNTNLSVITVGTNVYITDGNDVLFAAAPGSLVPNGTFEGGNTTGWANTANYTLAASQTFARTGLWSMRATATATASSGFQSPAGTAGWAVTPNTTYRARVWMRAVTAGRSHTLQINWYNAAGTQLAGSVNVGGFSDAVGSWTEISGVGTAPATAAFAQLQVLVNGTVAGEVHYYDDISFSGSSFSNSTIHGADAAQEVRSITTNGRYVWAAVGTSGIHRTINGATTSTANVPAAPASGNVHLVGWALGRLLAAGSIANAPNTGNTLWEVTDPLGAPALSVLRTHPDTSFRWAGISPGRNVIYAYGNTNPALDLLTGSYYGGKAEIYRITIEKTDTSLAVPTLATYLPDGESIHALQFYAGGIVMGTSRGVRLGTADGQGNIDYGPLIPTPGPVFALEPQDRYVWFSFNNPETASNPDYPATATAGLGRLDLGYFTEPLVPAWAADLEADNGDGTSVTASVTSCASISYPYMSGAPSRRVFAVSGTGIYREDSVSAFVEPTKVASGYFTTGAIRFATSEPKTTRSVELRHHALPDGGSITLDIRSDNGPWQLLGSSTATDSSGPPFPISANDITSETLELRFTITRASDTTATPELVRWTSRVLPTPPRDQVYALPIIMEPYVMSISGDGDPIPIDIAAEKAFLLDLEETGAIFEFQVGDAVHTGYIEAHQFEGKNWSSDSDGGQPHAEATGVYTVQIQTVSS